MRLFFVLTMGCIYFFFIRGWKKKPQGFYRNNKLFVWGHRGSPLKKTENTLPSFQKAIKQGVDGIELDVRCTKDKRVVIFHDQDLYRLTGKKQKIKEMTYEELKTITFHDNTAIPLLDDIASIIHQTKAINIEIKSDSLFNGYSAVKPVVEFIKKKLVPGAYLMIDDFTNIDPSGKSIRELFKQEFINYDFEIVGYFGIDGVIIRYFGLKKFLK